MVYEKRTLAVVSLWSGHPTIVTQSVTESVGRSVCLSFLHLSYELSLALLRALSRDTDLA